MASRAISYSVPCALSHHIPVVKSAFRDKGHHPMEIEGEPAGPPEGCVLMPPVVLVRVVLSKLFLNLTKGHFEAASRTF
jgi:hypothetical protein